jgi:hypothetical protein
MSYVRPTFKTIKTIYSETVASTTASVASAITPLNDSVTLQCTTGSIWFNPLVTATTANGFKLVEGDVIDQIVNGTLSLISDTTTAKYQAIKWID